MTYVQFGSGMSAPEGWRSFDASPTLWIERRIPLVPKRWPRGVEFGDAVKGLPLPDRSCAAVYCSHVLEHLALDQFRAALRSTHRLLIPGGVFRLVMPDFQACIDEYHADTSELKGFHFLQYSGLGFDARPRSVRELVAACWGYRRHLWVWDFGGAKAELEAAGFRDIRRARYGDSPDPMFAKVEEEDRWYRALGIECRA